MFQDGNLSEDRALTAMRLGVNYSFPVALRAFKMTVRPLSILEEENIVNAVADHMNRLPAEKRTSMTENVLLAKEYLKRASTSDVGKEDGQIYDATLNRMTPEEILYLYKQYVDAKDRVNPELENMQPGELQSLVDALKKSPEKADWESQVSTLSRSQMVQLCRKLIHGD